MTRRAFAAAVFLFAAALAAGCRTLPVADDGLAFETRRAELLAAGSWSLRGRLAVETEDSRGFSGSFSWLQRGERSTLTVRGPLGGGVLEVDGTPQEMRLTVRGEEHVLQDPEIDLSTQVGWWIPVESLGEWLRGLPDARFPAVADHRGPAGAITALEQRGWRVDYLEYRLADGLLLPRRLTLAHEGLELRLSVDDFARGP